MCWALCSLTKYLRFVTETTHHEDNENAVGLNKTQNAAVLPLVEPIANFIQRATAELNAPHIPEEHRLYEVITREFMPAYKTFKSLIVSGVSSCFYSFPSVLTKLCSEAKSPFRRGHYSRKYSNGMKSAIGD